MKFRWNRVFYYLETLAALIRSTKKFGRTITLNNGLKFKWSSLQDLLEIKEVVLDREYEKEQVKTKPTDKFIVDIGGGLGDYAILSAKENPEAKIISFEPDPRRFGQFSINIIINKTTNLKILKEAVNKLSDIFKQTAGRTVDLLKIDCEGCEYGILLTAPNRELGKINRIILEYHESENLPKELLSSKLKKAGFAVKVYPREGVPHLGLMTANRKSF